MGRTSSKLVDKVIDRFDVDNDGTIDAVELQEWILDEQFCGNPEFKGESVQNLMRHFERVMGNVSGEITRDSMKVYLSSLKHKELRALTASLWRNTEMRRLAIRQVFDAIDEDGSQALDSVEILRWLSEDAYWTDVKDLTKQGRIQLINGLVKSQDGIIDFEEFAGWLGKWSIRRIRLSSAKLLSDRKTRIHQQQEKKKWKREVSNRLTSKALASASSLDSLGSPQ
eukprot:gb/GEZN01005935.1/.p1 GENE.gb/GEZN01005935.1/~~gb/GEZN01005935.1/.p1  ORF type:complete len:226 (-),score=36.67 gb/GEZN01005935.1/:112-789(-)